jgi:hypothetical protein
LDDETEHKPTGLLRRIFPDNRKWPANLPTARHNMRVISDLHFGFADRLRFLVSGHIKVDTLSLWQFTTAKAWTYSTATIEPPFADKLKADDAQSERAA